MSSGHETPTYLKNHEALIRAFGYWPEFHDSPLLALTYSAADASIDMRLHAFQYTSETDARGVFVLDKHHLVSFGFSGVTDADLSRLDVPNQLFELSFSPPSEFHSSGRFAVVLDSVMGPPLDGRFSATAGHVVTVKPCDEAGKEV